MSKLLNIIDKNAVLFTNKTIFVDETNSITYGEYYNMAKSIATSIVNNVHKQGAVLLFLNRNIKVPVALTGVMYSGNYYVVLDTNSPIDRINKIISTINPILCIYEESTFSSWGGVVSDIKSLKYEDIINIPENKEQLNNISNSLTTKSLAYVLFTSGSTGVPKGVVISHGNILSYMDWFNNQFSINESTIFGSQTPFYFSMSVSDMFASIMRGATYVIIPKQYFTFPIILINYMNTHKINTIYWVPSAFGIIANLDLFKYAKPEYLKQILFAGEVMPVKYLNYWKGYFPTLKYCNLFGPTESTDICTFYEVNREFANTDSLPIGKSISNCETFVVDENNQLVTTQNVEGELYLKGDCVALGYYNNTAKTSEMFVQNPLHNNYIDIVYKTGDLVSINSFGEYIYTGRKDFQIKRAGYRIELGEIENNALAINKMKSCACVYDQSLDVLSLYYVGDISQNDLMAQLHLSLPNYMVPTSVIKLDVMPLNANGKIDRQALKSKK